ncbi:MAG: hypothetical protein LRZ96_01675 [Candidatus Pacebacteria bacterium]|nr:hypothetical protein [Candidatus Paceibacterota bacterium]
MKKCFLTCPKNEKILIDFSDKKKRERAKCLLRKIFRGSVVIRISGETALTLQPWKGRLKASLPSNGEKKSLFKALKEAGITIICEADDKKIGYQSPRRNFRG